MQIFVSQILKQNDLYTPLQTFWIEDQAPRYEGPDFRSMFLIPSVIIS